MHLIFRLVLKVFVANTAGVHFVEEGGGGGGGEGGGGALAGQRGEAARTTHVGVEMRR